MVLRRKAGSSWVLTRVEPWSDLPGIDDPMVTTLRDVRRALRPYLERRVGWPILMDLSDPTGLPSRRVHEFFRRDFRVDQMSTRWLYAEKLFVFFVFLQRRGTSWQDATSDDVSDYRQWRLYDEGNDKRISAATWTTELAALRKFYTCARANRWLTPAVTGTPPGDEPQLVQPSVIEACHRVASNPNGSGSWRHSHARRSRDRWLTLRNLTLWRLVGLRGYESQVDEQKRLVATVPRETFRGRCPGRNIAFADWLLCTGLRLAEAGTLLDFALPAAVEEDVPIVGPGGRLRHYRVIDGGGLQSVAAYRVGERRYAIHRAARAGTYAQVRDRLDVDDVWHGTRGQSVKLTDGRVFVVTELSASQRQRMYVRGPGASAEDDRWEPAWLWLTDSGVPMQPESWHTVFREAHTAVTRAREAVGVTSPWVKVSPQSLRFTFAVVRLVALVRLADARAGRAADAGFSLENYRQAFCEVQRLLGHASIETTQQTYVEPVTELRRAPALLSG